MVLEHLILEDINKYSNLNKHQYGFRAKSSCAHAIYALKEVTNDARKKGKCAIALFLDFSKAFDKVKRIKLWYRLIKNMSPNFWLMFKNYYEVMVMFVESENGEFSDPFGA